MAQRIIVFGSPDRCGKTEISTALARKLGIKYFKASSEHETYLNGQKAFLDQLRHADTRMVDFLRQTGYSVVFDRAWCCEFSYAKVFKRETDMKILRYVDAEFAKMGAKVIIPVRSSYKGIIDDIDPTTKEERLLKLDAAYRDFAEWTHCRTLILNVDDEDLTRELNDILTWMGKKTITQCDPTKALRWTVCDACGGDGYRTYPSDCSECSGTGCVAVEEEELP